MFLLYFLFAAPSSGNILVIPDGTWTAVSTHYNGDYPPSRMIDGFVGTFFHTALGTQAYQWIQVNFGRELKVLLIRLTFHF